MQIEIAIIAAVASFAGTWLAAQLAFARFSKEKIWERKAEAYTAIFEALHYVGRWYEKHYEASIVWKDIEEEKTKQLKIEANKAEEELERRLGSETWLIPVPCRERLEKMTAELKSSAFKNTEWQPFLEDGCFIIQSATKDIRTMVINDLGLN